MMPVAFDFRKPPPGELGRQATKWLTAACRNAAGSWARLLPFPATLALGGVEVLGAGAALDSLSEDAIAIPLHAADSHDCTALLVFPRPLLLTLLAGLVGEIPAALPEDRELTELERSLVGYLAQELFAEPLEQTWPIPDPLRLTPDTTVQPRKAWTGEPGDLALFAWLNVITALGEHPIYLLVPRTGIWVKLGVTAAKPRPISQATEQMESLVREMPVELTVILGSADLSMSELAELQTGDVVILRQRVDQPLDGLLAGSRKFRVWPGVIGQKAAVMIDAASRASDRTKLREPQDD